MLAAASVLVGCATTPVPTATHVLPLHSEHGRCSGSVELAGSNDWAFVSDRLVRGQEARIAAYCDHAERYEGIGPSQWTVRGMSAVVWSNGLCDDALDVTLSGQPGLLCEYEFNGVGWLQAMAIVGEYFVTIGAEIPDGSASTIDEVRAMLMSASLTIN